MVDPLVTHGVDIALGPEGNRVARPLGSLVDERSLFAGKGPALGVVLDVVLLDAGAQALGEVSQVADHGEVAADRVLLLDHVDDPEADDGHHDDGGPCSGRPDGGEARDDGGRQTRRDDEDGPDRELALREMANA